MGSAVGAPLGVLLLAALALLLWRERRRIGVAERAEAQAQVRPLEPMRVSEDGVGTVESVRRDRGERTVEELPGVRHWELRGSGGVAEM